LITHFTETMRFLRGEWRAVIAALAVAMLISMATITVGRATDRMADSLGLSDALRIVFSELPFALFLALIIFYPPALMMVLLDRRKPMSFSASCMRALSRFPSFVLLALLTYAAAFAVTMIVLIPVAMLWSIARVTGEGDAALLMRGQLPADLIIWYLVALPLVIRSMLLAPAFTVMDGASAFEAWRRSSKACLWRAVWVSLPFFLPLLAVNAAHSLPFRTRGLLPHVMDNLPSTLIFWLMPATLCLALLPTIPIWMQTRESADDYEGSLHSPRDPATNP